MINYSINISELAYRLQFDWLNLRVAVICATYQPQRSYQENLWAESLADMGMTVRLFHPIKITHQPAQNPPVISTVTSVLGHQYDVQQIPSLFLPSHQYITQELSPAVIEFQPQVMILFGAIMHFGRSLCSSPALAQVPLVPIFSLNRVGRHPFRWWGRHLSWRQRALGVAFHLIRMPDALQAIRRASLSIANTPEATDILRQFIHGNLRIQWARKHIELPLGFCPHTFLFKSSTRQEVREKHLHLNSQDKLLLFSSRFHPDKWPAIWKVWQCVEDTMNHHKNVHMVWVGLSENKESVRLRSLIKNSKHAHRHQTLPFQSRTNLSMYYQSADIILFPQASISCQEAMGTGAYVYTIADPALNHLQSLYHRLCLVDFKDWGRHLNELMSHELLLDLSARHACAMEISQTLAYPYLIKEAFKQLALNLSDTGYFK